MNTQDIRNNRRRALRMAPLALALLGAISAQALAADDPCRVWNPATNAWEEDPALPTNAGREHGFENTTCHGTASAYGYRNNASAPPGATRWASGTSPRA